MTQMTNSEAGLQREVYLDEIARTLRRRISPLEAYETVQEMREHLDAMSAAYQEVGLEPVEAMKAAIQKFGASETLGTALVQPETKRSFRPRVFALFVNLLAEASLGSVVMIGADVMITRGRPGMDAIIGMDVLMGAVLGSTVALIGWFVSLSPRQYAARVMAAVTLLLAFTVCRRFVQYGHPVVALSVMVAMNAIAFVLAASTIKIAAFLKSLNFSVWRSKNTASN